METKCADCNIIDAQVVKDITYKVSGELYDALINTINDRLSQLEFVGSITLNDLHINSKKTRRLPEFFVRDVIFDVIDKLEFHGFVANLNLLFLRDGDFRIDYDVEVAEWAGVEVEGCINRAPSVTSSSAPSLESNGTEEQQSNHDMQYANDAVENDVPYIDIPMKDLRVTIPITQESDDDTESLDSYEKPIMEYVD